MLKKIAGSFEGNLENERNKLSLHSRVQTPAPPEKSKTSNQLDLNIRGAEM